MERNFDQEFITRVSILLDTEIWDFQLMVFRYFRLFWLRVDAIMN